MQIPNWLVGDPAQKESAEGLDTKVLQALLEIVLTDHSIGHSFGEDITNAKILQVYSVF